MTARDTYNSTVATAAQTKAATLLSAEAAKQETINASGCNVGYNLQTGNYANFAAAIKSAINAKAASVAAAEATKQATIAAARDTLRNAGDVAPV